MGESEQDTNAIVEAALHDLERLMWAITWDIANEDRWLLEPDEVFGELSLELVKTIHTYAGKPYNELKSLAVVCMRNRAHDLVATCYFTHRKHEATMQSLDDVNDDTDDVATAGDDSGPGYVQIGVNIEYFDKTGLMQKLSSDGQALVNEVLNPSVRSRQIIDLVSMRKAHVSDKNMWAITPTKWLMQRIMGWDDRRIDIAWAEVSKALLV